MMRLIFFVALFFAFASCKQQELKYQKPYFDFDSLVNRQVSALKTQKLQIQKKANISGSESSVSIAVDSVALARELDIFRQLDAINKPLFKNQYEIAEGPDTKSNLTVRTYRAKIKSTVPEVRFYFLENFNQLKKIEAKYYEENTLYFTSREAVLEFSTAPSKLLTGYSIKGKQKMILSDSVSFWIQSELVPQH